MNVRAAEFVNRLVIVADHAEIPVLFCEQLNQAELHAVCVLVLIHHDIAKALLIVGEHIGIRLEELHRFEQEVVKIQRVVLPK